MWQGCAHITPANNWADLRRLIIRCLALRRYNLRLSVYVMF